MLKCASGRTLAAGDASSRSQLLRISCCAVSQASTQVGWTTVNVFASIDLVISLFRNYASHTATGIRVVAFSARNEVNVAVHYRLASNRAAVDPYVETQHGRVLLQDEISGFSEQVSGKRALRQIQGQNNPQYAASG